MAKPAGPPISIHAPRVGCDGNGDQRSPCPGISIHAPRVGCDPGTAAAGRRTRDFNPRTPCGVRPASPFHDSRKDTHFNPRTPCGVRRGPDSLAPLRRDISIHAPRVGCDQVVEYDGLDSLIFQSTHPVWGATMILTPKCTVIKFQSTHPVWGATPRSVIFLPSDINFNPRTPCGVRPDIAISYDLTEQFQSTHPVWGATYIGQATWTSSYISIHAPRVGCDLPQP